MIVTPERLGNPIVGPHSVLAPRWHLRESSARPKHTASGESRPSGHDSVDGWRAGVLLVGAATRPAC